ncbi:hypothetical protein E2542_SST04747 [Spatholobus suberectus]|nr:hypothetical protein E2542_SST04747 [Spatholobus suberectus]
MLVMSVQSLQFVRHALELSFSLPLVHLSRNLELSLVRLSRNPKLFLLRLFLFLGFDWVSSKGLILVGMNTNKVANRSSALTLTEIVLCSVRSKWRDQSLIKFDSICPSLQLIDFKEML